MLVYPDPQEEDTREVQQYLLPFGKYPLQTHVPEIPCKENVIGTCAPILCTSVCSISVHVALLMRFF